MSIFVVLATDDPAILLGKIRQHFPDNYYEIGPGKWFLSSALVTAKQVSDLLEVTSPDTTANGINGVIVAIRGYYGRGSKDMWEWVAAKSVVANA